MRKAVVTYLVTAFALVVNPFFACEVGGNFRYGMRDIRAALDGTWSATVYSSEGPKTVTFSIKPGRLEQHARAGLVASAVACGHRDLVASAEACIRTTNVPLIVVALDGTTSVGNLWIGGLDFEQGRLEATIAGEEVRAHVTATGEVRDVESVVAVTLVHAPIGGPKKRSAPAIGDSGVRKSLGG